MSFKILEQTLHTDPDKTHATNVCASHVQLNPAFFHTQKPQISPSGFATPVAHAFAKLSMFCVEVKNRCSPGVPTSFVSTQMPKGPSSFSVEAAPPLGAPAVLPHAQTALPATKFRKVYGMFVPNIWQFGHLRAKRAVWAVS